MIREDFILDAINNLTNGAPAGVSGPTWADIEWQVDPIPVTEAELMAEADRLEAEYNAQEYQRLRKEAYPSIEEQLDMQYWDNINGTTVWQDTIDAIKVQYPKP